LMGFVGYFCCAQTTSENRIAEKRITKTAAPHRILLPLPCPAKSKGLLPMAEPSFHFLGFSFSLER
jgi:hypothetical protein